MDDFSVMRCVGGAMSEIVVPGKLGTTSVVAVGCSSDEETALGVVVMLIGGGHESE